MHILSPETDNCPSWISRRERMAVENILWSTSTKEYYRPGGDRTRNHLITSRTRTQLNHRGRRIYGVPKESKAAITHIYEWIWLIVLVSNDTSTLVGHFVSSSEKGRRAREEIVEETKERNRGERGKWMKAKKQKKKTIKKHPPLPLPAARKEGLAQL